MVMELGDRRLEAPKPPVGPSPEGPVTSPTLQGTVGLHGHSVGRQLPFLRICYVFYLNSK